MSSMYISASTYILFRIHWIAYDRDPDMLEFFLNLKITLLADKSWLSKKVDIHELLNDMAS